MFCTKCGKNIEDTASFCIHCGSKVEGQTAASQYAPQQQYAGYAPKKSNKGLMIGLIAGAAVVAIVLILVLVVFPGGSSEIMGKWYDESGFTTVEFMGGGKCKTSAMGFMEFEGNYTFDSGSKKGTITISAMGMTETSRFTLGNDGILNIEGAKYSRTPVDQINFGDMFGDFKWE